MEPTSALVFEDLLTEMAELVGVADYNSSSGEAIHPNDKGDINKLKRVANNGIRRFISEGPPLGWNWAKRIMSVSLKISSSGTATGGSATTLEDTALDGDYADDYYNGLILEIDGGTGIGETALITDYAGTTAVFTFAALSGGSTPDTTTTYRIGHRYALDQTFGGQPDGDITYLRGSGVGPINWINESALREWRENFTAGGNPHQAAIRPYGVRRFELIVYPDPGAAEVIQFPYTYYFDKLDILTGAATAAATSTPWTLTDTGRKEPLNYFKTDWIIEITGGTGIGSYGVVTGYVKTTGVFTVAGWLDIDGVSVGTPPVATDTYRLLPVSNLQPAGFAFDNVIRLVCMAAAEAELDDVQTLWEGKYLQALGNAYKIDARLAPRTVGNFGQGGMPYSALVRRRYYDYGRNNYLDTNTPGYQSGT
ncbi:hypothetical protein LCGC14_1685270 [marine sediment metagenome]|uniref:Uncharacterized protein n=1 Tax=marine sediment metagenome TaxID=412755 RepID=A0A0F9HMT9_9ZZZZ